MPRGRKKATVVNTEQGPAAIDTAAPSRDGSESVNIEGGTEMAVAAESTPPTVEPAGTAATVAELREATQDILDRSGAASGELPQRERFRTWVSDVARGYTRMSDNEYQRTILQFQDKPSPEVLAEVKAAGFHFQPDYCGLKNAWVRRNDYTGRVRVDAIEKLIRAQSVEAESPAL